MKILYIDDYPEEVMDYTWSRKEIDIDSGRNLYGVMERDIAEHHPITIKATFPPQNLADRSATLTRLNNPYMRVRCLDADIGGLAEHICMHGDLDSSIYWSVDDENDNPEVMYKAFTVDIVEY